MSLLISLFIEADMSSCENEFIANYASCSIFIFISEFWSNSTDSWIREKSGLSYPLSPIMKEMLRHLRNRKISYFLPKQLWTLGRIPSLSQITTPFLYLSSISIVKSDPDIPFNCLLRTNMNSYNMIMLVKNGCTTIPWSSWKFILNKWLLSLFALSLCFLHFYNYFLIFVNNFRITNNSD